MEKLDEQEVDLSNELDDEMEENKFDKIAAVDALEEITLSMQEAAQRLTQAQFRKLKDLMQVYFRDY
jgi:hypothetical protein